LIDAVSVRRRGRSLRAAGLWVSWDVG
jgi:hypothetical protein